MKILKKVKKGFTLVELVVVIAVIAILAAASVGVYFGVTESAKKSNDQTVTNQMNKALLLDATVNGNPKTPTDALEVLDESGFDVVKMTPFQDDAYYLWDSVENKMILINKEGNVDFPTDVDNPTTSTNPEKYFGFIQNDAEKQAQDYSYYLKNGYSGSTTFTAGIDTGNNNLESVSYENSDEQEVIIRTNSATTELIVNAPNGTVKHYDTVGTVHVIAVDDENCYEENGKAAFTQVDSGKYKTTSTADVELLFVSNSSNVTLEIAEGTVAHAHAISETEANTINSTNPGVTFDYDGNDAQSELDVYHHVENDDKMNLTTDFNDNKNNESVQHIVEEAISEEIIEKGAENGNNYVARYETTGYMSVGEAINAAPTSGKVYILKDADVNPSDFSKKVTLVGNKQTLKFIRGSENNTDDALNVFKVNGELTIDLNGRTIQGKSFINSTYYEPLIVNNGKLTIKDSVGGGLLTTNSNSANAVALLNLGDFVLESGTLGGPLPGSNTFKCGTPIIVGSNSTTTINGGKIIGDSRAIGLNMAKQNMEPTATINDTSFNSVFNNKIVINGGILASRSVAIIDLSTRVKGAGNCDETTNEIIINGGTFQHVNNDAEMTYKSESAEPIIKMQNGHANITINDGTFNASNGDIFRIEYKSYYNTSLTINGGTFNTAEGRYILNVNNAMAIGTDTNTAVTFNVNGGNFSMNENLSYYNETEKVTGVIIVNYAEGRNFVEEDGRYLFK